MEKPLALLFVDIADSTLLYELAGDRKAAALTQRVLESLGRIVGENAGTVVKSLGDGLLASFPITDGATRAALAMMDRQGDFGLRLRAGLHFGPVISGPGDLYGDACNVAARLESIARPGEILATDDLVDRLSPPLRKRARLLNSVAVKGKAAPVRVHQIRSGDAPPEAEDNATIGLTLSEHGSGRGLPSLRLSGRRAEATLTPLLPRVTVGRDETCGLRIPSRRTSRQHAVIDFSRGGFLLTDHSTNGTFIRTGIRTGDSPSLLLRRDSTKLTGSGLIGFGGEPLRPDEDHVLAFQVGTV
ncbi:adenylate/guanylate cyclase domain-containing protein [Roseomonas genomospecies 6]|uniref:Adenylate/guanylate cyclase domain-containing protein n=1 Tax=Roseomonas genomospecies 6 TaxID=214106 RepID=A0A9W7TZ55_9PROT|nr:adenylate/guanylate cyclase domain-containing protein [Roseomonas genomospecies 6]KAA0680962.1 adenylate/guanylate cyclase domain-containing protein [Roseomonas genomospecies 6]